MTRIKTLLGFLIMSFALGIGICSMPQTATAQTDKDKKEKKQERKDDDNDADEKLSRDDARKAKISLEEARAIALKRVNGMVLDEELEKERGRLQYAFDIRTSEGKVFDVEIDATTGEVLKAVEEDDDEDDPQSSQTKRKNVIKRQKALKK